ncbi:ketopantoate reductase family protein [Chloroflexota bacterium]
MWPGSGSTVKLIGRPGQVDAIKRHGLKLISPFGTQVVGIPAFTHPNQIDFKPEDVVFLCVKGQSTEEALGDLKAVTEDIPVFCFQNGVRNEEIASRYFRRVYGVMVGVGAIYLTDGEIMARRDPPGRFVIGRYPDGTDIIVDQAAELLENAGFRVIKSASVMAYKWGKLIGNLANSIGAITDVEKVNTQQMVQAVQNEAKGILTEAGIEWVSMDAKARPVESINNIKALSSTWQSLARKQGTVETEYLNGEIVRVAERLGRRAPLNEVLLQTCKKMAADREVPGKYTPQQLQVLLGLD